MTGPSPEGASRVDQNVLDEVDGAHGIIGMGTGLYEATDIKRGQGSVEDDDDGGGFTETSRPDGNGDEGCEQKNPAGKRKDGQEVGETGGECPQETRATGFAQGACEARD